MSRFSSVVIGNGSLLIGCSENLLDRGHSITAVVSTDAQIREWAITKGIRVLESVDALADVGAFDWLFSIANLSIIPQIVLDLPAKAAINFHDGPLPRHAGLNAPVWAILEGETDYGITWHMLEGGVDEGDIVAQSLFPIAPDDTAYSLNSKCYAAGLDAFGSVLDQLGMDRLSRRQQDLSQRSYHARNDRPRGAGILSFDRPTVDILRDIRALDFGKYWNPLVAPKIKVGSTILVLKGASLTSGQGSAGDILSVNQSDLIVATSDGAVRIEGISDVYGRPIPLTEHAAPGQSVSDATEAEVAEWDRHLQSALPGEASARRALTAMTPAVAPLVQNTGKTGFMIRRVEVPSSLGYPDLALGLLILAGSASDAQRVDIAVSDSAMQLSHHDALTCAWRPVGVDLNLQYSDARSRVSDDLRVAQKAGVWPCDLVARDPDIRDFAQPDIALLLGTHKPLDGSALTLSMADDAATLHFDAAKLDDAAADILTHRLAYILTQLAPDSTAQTLASIPTSSPFETELMLEHWNATEHSYDATTTIQDAFEAQVTQTPEAIALIFEGEEISYAALNSRANAIAKALRDTGVDTGNHVGIYVQRSIDMVAATLGALKAGAAYVPLDPSYPAQRIAHYISDSGASAILTTHALAKQLPEHAASVLPVEDVALTPVEDTQVERSTATDLAYVIYTSGSTGTPKGVMVQHKNVVNFFAAMDDRIPFQQGDTWLAVTSLNFDISVLELLWTLTRGFRVVLAGDDTRLQMSGAETAAAPDQGMAFNLFYWGNDDGVGPKKYELLLEGAKFADQNGFNAVWTPERHFDAFGGPYPNPSVTGAAVAAVTQNIGVRAGSCVAPLHHPARIAEEWAIIDNLTNGRAALGIASGWQPDDFVLRPENTPPANKPAMFETIDVLRKLWRGESVAFPTANGDTHTVVTQPRPVSTELPLWVTTAGNPETWREAGKIGANVLTHLLGQSIDEVAEKIAIYHAALQEAGHDPDEFVVTLMLHTYLDTTRDAARAIAREPMKDYLRSAAGLIKQYAWAFPAFKKPQGVTSPFEMDLGSLSEDELEAILDFAFERYFEESGLFGTVDDAVQRVNDLKRIGVGEIACLIDYGIAPEIVLEGLKPLADVLSRTNEPAETQDLSIAGLIREHNVTHLQCTPSLARVIASDPVALEAVSGIEHLLLGGEALPGDLARTFQENGVVTVHNMYGPTETTIWSTCQSLSRTPQSVAALGTPVANTTVYVLDGSDTLAPIGQAGELCIAGDGVTAGYWQRPELTAQRFPIDPFGNGLNRMYRTGDLVRWRSDGSLEFLGRTDQQVKIRGQRIELGEIEAALTQLPGVDGAVTVAHADALTAFVTGTPELSDIAMKSRLAEGLSDAMIPSHIHGIETFPLTPNKKIDRKALMNLKPVAAPERREEAVPSEGTLSRVARIWSGILGQPNVQPGDNFFELGGHSLLAVQMHRELRDGLGLPSLGITDIFRFPILKDLSSFIDGLKGATTDTVEVEDRLDQPDRAQTMSKRRAMRAGRRARTK